MPKLILGADRVVMLLSNFAIASAAFFLAVMAVLGTIDVLGLNLFGTPVQTATEGASAMLALSVALALSHTQKTRSHIAVDILSKRFPSWLALPVSGFSLLLSILVLFFIAWGAWVLALHSYSIGERAVAAVRFPLWPVKIIFAIGCSLCVLELVREFLWLVVSGDKKAGFSEKNVSED